VHIIQDDTKKRELLKNPIKIEEIQEKRIIDRNWTITTCLLRDSNPNYQCLKITSRRWHPPPRMHSFTATKHFKSSCSFVSLCVCCMLCRMRRSCCAGFVFSCCTLGWNYVHSGKTEYCSCMLLCSGFYLFESWMLCYFGNVL